MVNNINPEKNLKPDVNKLAAKLRECPGGMKVTFKKVDGSLRTGVFTLHESKLPPIKKDVKPRAVNPNQLNMYEVSTSSWKSCKKDSVVSFEEVK